MERRRPKRKVNKVRAPKKAKTSKKPKSTKAQQSINYLMGAKRPRKAI